MSNCSLLASAYLSLGRALVVAGYQDLAVNQFAKALDLEDPCDSSLFLDLLVAEAENFIRNSDYYEAIRLWQDITSLLGANTPAYIYQRLSEAYTLNGDNFGGSQKENFCWGDRLKLDVLAEVHDHLSPQLYLEIGVDQGQSLALARCQAFGIDARPNLKLSVELSPQVTLVAHSSDAFFREQAAFLLAAPPDLVFIDGMHFFEFALRDFMNVEQHAGPSTLVVIDDIYPCHPAQATRRRRTTSWTGDVWKLHQILRDYRPDLTLLALNTYPTGMLLVAGLDPGTRVLWDHYEALVRTHRADRAPPPDVLARRGALPSDHPILSNLLARLRDAREASWDLSQVRQLLHEEFREWLQQLVSEFSHRSARAAAGLTSTMAEPGFHEQPIAQLYLPQAEGPGFTENASIKSELVSGAWQDLIFRVPKSAATGGQSLRFDPVNRAGLVQIDQLRLVDEVTDSDLFTLVQPGSVDALRTAGDVILIPNQSILTLYALGADPQILLPALPDTVAADHELALYVRLRFEMDTNDLRQLWTERDPLVTTNVQLAGTNRKAAQSSGIKPDHGTLQDEVNQTAHLAWLDKQLEEKLALLAGFERRQVDLAQDSRTDA